MVRLVSPGGVEINASDEDAVRLVACGFTTPEENQKPAPKPKPKAPAKRTTKRKA